MGGNGQGQVTSGGVERRKPLVNEPIRAMAKRRGPYQRYLEDYTADVPRSTKHRWKVKNTGCNVDSNTDDPSSSSNEDELNNDNSSTTTMIDIIQKNDNKMNTEEHCMDTSTSEGEDEELSTESMTTCILDVHIPENEEAVSYSEDNLTDTSSNQGENHADDEDMMEGNNAGEKTPKLKAGSEDQADGDNPLYPGASISKGESLLMLMSYVLRHNLTGKAVTHLLEMFNLMFPGLIPSSHYLFHKEFKGSSQSEIHFYCEKCLAYLGNSAHCNSQCTLCNKAFDANRSLKNGFYFLVIPLHAQIKQLLQELDVSLTDKTRSSGVLTDIQSGEEYQKLVANEVLGKDDLTLIWNCDGAPVFKSSKCSIWPIQSQIIELEPEERKRHILMSALWFGPAKPSMITLLTPFVEEAAKLEADGIAWQDRKGHSHVSKVFVLICSSDSVARPLLRNTKQFNGFYGCDFCLHKGGKTYPYEQPEPPLRNERDHYSHAMSGTTDEPVCGVKGPSPLMQLQHFQMINGFIPDYQHNVCLGITRQLSTLWFDSSNKDSPWFIGKEINEVDRRLAKIKPPVEITRTTRSLSERKFWKASEWRAFLLFYSLPVLKGILPARFWNHLFLLVFGIYTLLQHTIKTESILVAELALKKFVIVFQRLYGKNNMTFNIHLLTHTAHSVKQWGPLWATSTFSFESNMGTLKKYFNGTQYVPSQIVRTFLLWRELPERAKNTIPPENEKVRSFFEELYFNKRKTESCKVLTESVRGFGNPTMQKSIKISYRLAIAKLCGNLSNCFWSFNRFLVNGVLYHSQKYDKLKKRYNSAVCLKDGTLCLTNDLVIFKQKCSHEISALCSCTKMCCVLVEVLAKLDRPVCKDSQINIQSTFLFEVKKTETVNAVWPDMLLTKCVLVERDDALYITPLPNAFERD
ncbi:uncharacterized protein LOC119789497 isoform X2 [Cyprinodon tularosa]|uniref:uncharacterized protein LOC119789497 isoform X2 n=1 Tax=Cyprinodon tularosa TaxID=77115 RepID=UPI0018E210B2|nr:uncharacterized protein LOC119789497 isoform X2 [Cyprinodon tularosa]